MEISVVRAFLCVEGIMRIGTLRVLPPNGLPRTPAAYRTKRVGENRYNR